MDCLLEGYSVTTGRATDRGRRNSGQCVHGLIGPMAVDAQTSIEIDAPRAQVAAFAANPDNSPLWYINIKAVTWETPPPASVGSRIAFLAHFLGRGIAYTHEVRELVTNEVFVMSTAEGPFPMQTTYTWQDTASGGDPDDPSQHRRTVRLGPVDRAGHVGGHAPGKPQGPQNLKRILEADA